MPVPHETGVTPPAARIVLSIVGEPADWLAEDASTSSVPSASGSAGRPGVVSSLVPTGSQSAGATQRW